jgi:protein RecA
MFAMADDRMSAENRGKAIDMALANIEKKFGKGSIMRLGEKEISDIPAISTSSLSIDAALGVGGVPRGRVIEIFGPESSGKTTLALHIVAEAQRPEASPRILMRSTRWIRSTPESSAWILTAF